MLESLRVFVLSAIGGNNGYQKVDTIAGMITSKKLTAPCSCPYTRHQQNPYPVLVRIGVDRRVTVVVVVTDKGSGYAKRNDRGKENKREEEGMRESNNTFRRHCGWLYVAGVEGERVGSGWKMLVIG